MTSVVGSTDSLVFLLFPVFLFCILSFIFFILTVLALVVQALLSLWPVGATL